MTAAEFHEYNDWCWSQIGEDYRAFLLGPRRVPVPCAWCGGHYRHADGCCELLANVGGRWVFADEGDVVLMSGRYKGLRVREVPVDWLERVVVKGGLPDHFLGVVRRYLRRCG